MQKKLKSLAAAIKAMFPNLFRKDSSSHEEQKEEIPSLSTEEGLELTNLQFTTVDYNISLLRELFLDFDVAHQFLVEDENLILNLSTEDKKKAKELETISQLIKEILKPINQRPFHYGDPTGKLEKTFFVVFGGAIASIPDYHKINPTFGCNQGKLQSKLHNALMEYILPLKNGNLGNFRLEEIFSSSLFVFGKNIDYLIV